MAPRCRFFWALCLSLIVLITAAEEQVEGCFGSANTCGNVTISNPFWLTDLQTGRSCGSSDFKVTCLDNTPSIRSTGTFGFAIINITYEDRSMRAIDLGQLELLHASNSCYASWNTSVKLGSSFRISPVNLNLIQYNCTTAEAAVRRDGALVETRMRCGNESRVFAGVEGFYDEMSDNAGHAVEGCEAIVVPVLGGPNGEANASDYQQLISDGLLFSWDGFPPLPLDRKFAHP